MGIVLTIDDQVAGTDAQIQRRRAAPTVKPEVRVTGNGAASQVATQVAVVCPRAWSTPQADNASQRGAQSLVALLVGLLVVYLVVLVQQLVVH